MKKSKLAALSSSLMVTLGCSSVQVAEYKNEKPKLVLENYLSGQIEAHGFFQDRSGQVKKRFYVDMKGTWKDGVGTLDEHFTYSDGSRSRRVWTIRKKSENLYIGTADDVVGEAIGEVAGNALRWRYVLKLDVDGKTYHVDFDDWMYLMDDRVMLNKSKMSKWGIYLGEVTLSFYKK